MVIVISPAKTLDFESPAPSSLATVPLYSEKAEPLIQKLRTLSKKRLMHLMDISQDLAELNMARYLQWQPGNPIERSKQALLAFKGEVYLGINAQQFELGDFDYAQAHLRILSGLYGVLRPMDMIQPYRLEMGIKLKVDRKKDLYDYWGARITEHLNATIAESGSPFLLNLASQEYFGAVLPKQVAGTIVTPIFLDKKGEGYKVVSFWAKKARGLMTAWIIGNRLNEVEGIKDFVGGGYRYNAALSKGAEWAFTRDSVAP
jgi:uncharacterized protein